MRVVRRPARPCWSMEYCQERNSSTVSVYRLQASSSESSPPRTAATTSALRRMTQRLVPGAGKSAIVSGLPSGPITYLALGRRGSVMNKLTHSTDQLSGQTYSPPLKIYLSTTLQLGKYSLNWGGNRTNGVSNLTNVLTRAARYLTHHGRDGARP